MVEKSSQRQRLIKAVPHIRLGPANQSKLAALDALAAAYLPFCQQYVTLFCTGIQADGFHPAVFPSLLSERWQRCAIQQAAGIAQSWCTKHNRAYQEFEERRVWYEAQPAEVKARRKAPEWKEWRLPELRSICLQVNVNVMQAIADSAVQDKVLTLEQAQRGTFDAWLKVATLDKGHPIYLPVKLADYHRTALAGKQINGSVTLHRRGKNWWLTVSFTEAAPDVKPDVARPKTAPDIGLASYLTSSDGKHYGTFHGKLAERHAADRAKRQRKAKLRACLEKKGVTNLPSTSSASGQRLCRHVKQEINRAVKEFMNDHPDHEIVLEKLSVSALHFKSRRMNARLSASQLGHVQEQIEWLAAQRGQPITYVNPAYSSQECSRCHHTERKNRPNQQTFCCRVCGFRANADENAACNLERRAGDGELAACGSLEAVKKLLLKRHETWRQENGWP